MNTQTNKNLKNIKIKIHPIKSWKILFVLVMIVAFTVLPAAGPTQTALADAGNLKANTFDVTFTKWVTSLPAHPPSNAGISMAGVVGGDVGEGLYAGKVLSDNLTVPGFWLAHARYEFYGNEHHFIASVHVKENDMTNPATAVITGVITHGWLKGAHLTGKYTVMTVCPIATQAMCLVRCASRVRSILFATKILRINNLSKNPPTTDNRAEGSRSANLLPSCKVSKSFVQSTA
jgi:hypothetical protein